MKAIVFHRYGPPQVLQLSEVDKPEPKAQELLIKVHATTARTGDCRMRRADPFVARIFNGLLRPRRMTILGMELAGEVEAVGRQVTRFAVGDRVFASTELRFGGYAEYTCLPDDGVVARMPANLSFQQAAAVPSGGIGALKILKKGNIQPEQKVVINGASGSVGSFAVQLARHFGAHVTGVCGSSNLEWVSSLGAEEVIDYPSQDFIASGARYDLIFDAVGKMMSGISKSKCQPALLPGGTYVSIEMDYKGSAADLVFLRELVEAGEVTPILDRCYPLRELPAALRRLSAGHTRGKLGIAV